MAATHLTLPAALKTQEGDDVGGPFFRLGVGLSSVNAIHINGQMDCWPAMTEI